jgi:hypothetical protein
MKSKLILCIALVLSGLLSGCVTNKPVANVEEKYALISKAMTTGSPTTRENALLELLPDAKEIKLNDDLLYTVADTNCDCSEFEAIELTSFSYSHIYHVVDNYYINFGETRFFPSDFYLSLLVELRYPNENLRYAIVAQQKLSDKGLHQVNLIKPDTEKF